MATIHTPLKKWLVDLGNSTGKGGKRYYHSYSGDRQPFDVRVNKRRIDFQPDVIWEHPGQTCVFEIAREEDWRAMVGEVTLAALSGKVDKVFIITDYPDSKITEAISIMDGKYKELGWLKHGADHISVAPSLSEAKDKITDVLKRKEWIS